VEAPTLHTFEAAHQVTKKANSYLIVGKDLVVVNVNTKSLIFPFTPKNDVHIKGSASAFASQYKAGFYSFKGLSTVAFAVYRL
jgi:hypothetical protein